MKSNRQIGLDGRVFITDCLSDGIFFVYSIILSGFLGAAGDIMKLLGQSSRGMDAITNSLIICDLVCSLSMIIVTYYVYFMHCGENIPKLGTKPLIFLEYLRLAYYGVLAYEVIYRFACDLQSGSGVPAAIPIFYFFYFAWIVCCICAAMFILTVLHQNVIRRSYAKSFKILALAGLVTNVIVPLVYFITRIWVRGWGDGFYSAGLCDFVRFALAPVFYAAVWFLFMSAIDQVDRVFNEVDNAIRDRRYRIEIEEKTAADGKASSKKKYSGMKKKSGGKKSAETEIKSAKNSGKNKSKSKSKSRKPKSDSNAEKPKVEDIKVDIQPEGAENEPTGEKISDDVKVDDIILNDIMKSVVVREEPEQSTETVDAQESVEQLQLPEIQEVGSGEAKEKGAKKVKPKKKHRITEVEEESAKVEVSVRSADELAADISESVDSDEKSGRKDD